jgi:uncharacterized protein (DUF1015 family)
MVDIRPFAGVRYSSDRVEISDVVGKPFDTVSYKERREFLAHKKGSIYQLTLASPMDSARQYYDLKAGHVLVQDPNGYYLLKETYYDYGKKETQTRTLLFAAVSLRKYNRDVLPHEHIRDNVMAQRATLRAIVHADLEPIFSAYASDNHIDSLLEEGWKEAEQLAPFSLDCSSYEQRRLDSRTQAAKDITDAFKQKKIYILDGHHRTEAAILTKYASPFVMMALVSNADVGMIPYNRLIKADKRQRNTIIRHLVTEFDVLETERPIKALDGRKDRYAVAFIQKKGPAFIATRPMNMPLAEDNKHLQGLSVWLLDDLFMPLATVRPEQVTYQPGHDEAFKALSKGHDCAFLLNPPTVEQVMRVAEAHDKMPRKSTYFWPKPPSGAVIRPF